MLRKNPILSNDEKCSKQRYLLISDIDGTITQENFEDLNPKIIRAFHQIKNINNPQNIVCLSTGRNYHTALLAYRQLGIDGILVCYNGALVVNPDHPNKAPFWKLTISNDTVKAIVNDPFLKQHIKKIAIDRDDFTVLVEDDDPYYEHIIVRHAPFLKGNVLKLLGNQDALQLVLEIPSESHIANKVITTLRKKYGEAVDFYGGSKLRRRRDDEPYVGSSELPKEASDKILVKDEARIILKLRNAFVNKATAAEFMASYYNVGLWNTMAFGNDSNDDELLMKVGKGVATDDCTLHLKLQAYGIADQGAKTDINSEKIYKYLVEHFELDKK